MWLQWPHGSLVGARDLKNRLGSYLRAVREGTRIIVTERGKPVANSRPSHLLLRNWTRACSKWRLKGW